MQPTTGGSEELSIPEAIGLATKLFTEERFGEAIRVLKVVVELDPENHVAQERLGVCLAGISKKHPQAIYEALYRLDRAVRIKKTAFNLANRGMVLGDLGHNEEALSDLLRATAMDPKNAVFWNNLGNVQINLERYREAITSMDRCIAIDPKHALSYHNRGIALLRLGREIEGAQAMMTALELDPSNEESRFNLGLAQLMMGDYANGFANYESRWNTPDYDKLRQQFPQTGWQGEDIAGRTLLVYGDQGLGDAIMLARYLPMLATVGAKLVMIMHTPLISMFRETFGDLIDVLEPGAPMPQIDYRCAMASFPRIFGTRLDSIPKPVPFKVDDVRCAAMDKIMSGARLKVGVCWSGNFKHKNDHNRSMAFTTFSRLFGAKGVDFYSLQYEVREEDEAAYNTAIDSGQLKRLPLNDFHDTVAAIACMDLVVTVDTSVANLAATQGRPTWIMLPTPRIDWRWMRDRTDAPWYPSVRLFRQKKSGDWLTVLNDVQSVLRLLVADKAA